MMVVVVDPKRRVVEGRVGGFERPESLDSNTWAFPDSILPACDVAGFAPKYVPYYRQAVLLCTEYLARLVAGSRLAVALNPL